MSDFIFGSTVPLRWRFHRNIQDKKKAFIITFVPQSFPVAEQPDWLQQSLWQQLRVMKTIVSWPSQERQLPSQEDRCPHSERAPLFQAALDETYNTEMTDLTAWVLSNTQGFLFSFRRRNTTKTATTLRTAHCLAELSGGLRDQSESDRELNTALLITLTVKFRICKISAAYEKH